MSDDPLGPGDESLIRVASLARERAHVKELEDKKKKLATELP